MEMEELESQSNDLSLLLAGDCPKQRTFDDEKEDLHLFTGLFNELLNYDEESHMLWEESIVVKMMANISDAFSLRADLLGLIVL